MTLTKSTRITLFSGMFFMFSAVILGAFGAHGLKNIVTSDALLTFETGVRYQIYHGLGLLLIGILQFLFPIVRIQRSSILMIAGIILFSFNCYIYVLTQIKFFALIIPLGGISLVVSWIVLIREFLRAKV